MKRYYLYLGLLIISLLGTDLTDFTLAVWILDQPDTSVSSYTLTWFFEAAPAVLLSVFIGSFVDRWDKKKMIIYGQLIAGIGSIILFIFYWQNILAPWHIMLVAGIGSIASMFVFQSFFVATKALVDKKDLIKTQALLSMCYGIIQMAIPILAPIIYRLIGIGNVFLIDIITFSISIIGFIFLGHIVAKNTADRLSIKNDLQLVREFIVQKIGFLYLLLFAFFGQFFTGLIVVLLTPLLLDFSNEYTLGIVYACIGLGSILGSGIMSKKRNFTSPTRKIIRLHALVGLIIMSFLLSVSPYFIAIIGMLAVTLFVIKDTLYDSLILTIVPEQMLGRFSGVVGLVVGIASPVSFLLSGFLVDVLNSLFNDSTYIDFYPGSVVTLSIVVLFAITGLLLTVFSLVFKDLKGIKLLDKLYIKELNTNMKKKKDE